jgi:hypothetical protein
MADKAWRDSFVIKAGKPRPAREDEVIEKDDNSTLLELERKINQAKPTGGDGLFAGTSFEIETPTQANLIKSGLSISASNNNDDSYEPTSEEQEELAGGKKESKRVTIYNRATAVLEDFADRISSSGGTATLRRKSKDEDSVEREKSTDMDRRRSTAPKQRVKSVVAKISRVTSRRKTKGGPAELTFDADTTELEAESTYSSANPTFTKPKEKLEE